MIDNVNHDGLHKRAQADNIRRAAEMDLKLGDEVAGSRRTGSFC